MADEKKRIINETTDSALASSGDYVIVDSQTEGTRKFDLGAALVGKVDTVSGKGLSTNDYTTEEKTKLEGIATGATNVTVDNTLSNSGQAADAKKTGDELSQLNEDLNYIEPIVAPIKTGIVLVNGTIQNPYNANAVRTSSAIPCKVGDTITVYPVRQNTSGYYYAYGYRIYDTNGNTIVDVQNAAEAYNPILVAHSDAASIDIFWVETDGSNYISLRANTYGANPYAMVRDGTSNLERINSFSTMFVTGERLAASDWQQGGISSGVETESDARIRSGYVLIATASAFIVDVDNRFGYAINYYDTQKQYISSSSSWIFDSASYDNSTFNGATYIRIVLRNDSNSAVTPTRDSGKIRLYATTLSQDAINYISRDETTLEADHYTNLLSQARFSPTSGAKVLTLMHFSDIHDNRFAMDKAIELSAIYASKIDDMIHTGDVVLANYSDGLTNWIASGCAEKVISVIGNHDSEENLVLGTAGKTTVYGGMLAPYIDNWGVVQPTGVNDSSSGNYCACYYYKDYASVSMRLIILDTNWWDNYQKTWLSETLADALTKNYAVILACHTPRFVTGITDANFCSYTEPIINEPSAYANIPNDWLDPVDTFISDGGEVVCMLAGHNHRDHIGYLTNYPDILCITADKASVARTIDTARITGEENATAFNFLTFNTTDKWIKIIRIGAEVDGQMRGKHVFCYDYANKRIISQW